MSIVTLDQFRAAVPAMADVYRFPDPSIQIWLDAADARMNADRWGDLYTVGACMFAAHFVSGDTLMLKEGTRGGAPGLRSGAITSESGDSVSVSFDTSGTNIDGDGHWNQTIYGKRFKELSRLVGAGPVQVGQDATGVIASAAWYGPQVGFPF